MSRCAWMLSGLLLACVAPARAGVPETPAFRTLGVAQGLPSSSVNALAQDRAGYIWVATADGLARHDGVGFRTWRHDPADPGSLPGNNVQALHIDAQDRVWVAIEGGGLSVLDARRRRFRHFRMATHPQVGSDDTWAIASRDGVTWFGTWGGGLHRMDRDGRITRFEPVDGDTRSLPAANVLALAFDRRGRLWVGTTHGLARWTGRGFERVPVAGAAPEPVVYALVPDGDALWVGTGQGLHRRVGDGRWIDPPWAGRFARPGAALALARDHDGGWWIGAQDGLWRIDRDGRPSRVALAHAAATASVGALLVDRDGALWAGSSGNGLGYLRASWRQLAQFPPAGDDRPARYRAVAAARGGGLWLAGTATPPERLDARGRVQRLGARARRSLAGMRIRALAESAGGVLWAGGREQLSRITPAGAVRSWRIGGREPPPGGIDLLRVAADGSLWLSSAGAGVQQRSADGAILRDWRAGTHGLRGADIEAMAIAPDGAVWIAGEGGVSRLAPGADAFVPLAQMGHARAYAFALDGGSIAWVARPTGLEQYRLGAGGWSRAAVFGTAQGLPDVEASGLVVDRMHRAWLATPRGLFRWDRATRRARRFGVQDGLRSQEFIARGMALAGDGVLAAIDAGGGLVLADTLAPQSPPAPRGLQLDDVAIRDAGHWRSVRGSALALPADVRELRVRVRLLAYATPASIRYESWLEGDDRGWLPMEGGDRVFAGLRAGAHALRLRATDADGNRTPERIVRWRLMPPWWRMPLALAGWALLAILSLLLIAVSLRARWRSHRRMRWLEHGRALAEQASRAKSRFLADLGHEVRTPMTGVLGMSDLLLDGRLDPRQRRQVEAIRGAGQHLLRLVDDALDLARIEAGRLVLDQQAFDLHALVAEVAALQAPLARKRGLRFVAVVARDAPLVLRGDAMRIKQVLFNLLGNAIKFTGQGEVGLHAVAMDGGGLRFTVDDTGPGMDPVQQARLFRRFEQGDDGRAGAGYGGFGLGLAISRELVLAMGGCIRVDGAAGAGTRVVVELPLDVVDPSPADYRDVSSRKSMSPAM